MATVISIPDEYMKKVIEITGEYHPKKAILKLIDMAYAYAKAQFTTGSEIGTNVGAGSTTSGTKSGTSDSLERAIKYVNAIIKRHGFVTTEQLEKTARKFNVDFWDIVKEMSLIEFEKGKWKVVEE